MGEPLKINNDAELDQAENAVALLEKALKLLRQRVEKVNPALFEALVGDQMRHIAEIRKAIGEYRAASGEVVEDGARIIPVTLVEFTALVEEEDPEKAVADVMATLARDHWIHEVVVDLASPRMAYAPKTVLDTITFDSLVPEEK